MVTLTCRGSADIQHQGISCGSSAVWRPVAWATVLLFWSSVGTSLATAIDHDVVVSVYQGVCRDGDFAANLAAARQVISEAKTRGSHFLVLPETFLSGYASRADVERGARPLDDPELRSFIAESATHDIVVVIGLARKAAGSPCRANSRMNGKAA